MKANIEFSNIPVTIKELDEERSFGWEYSDGNRLRVLKNAKAIGRKGQPHYAVQFGTPKSYLEVRVGRCRGIWSHLYSAGDFKMHQQLTTQYKEYPDPQRRNYVKPQYDCWANGILVSNPLEHLIYRLKSEPSVTFGRVHYQRAISVDLPQGIVTIPDVRMSLSPCKGELTQLDVALYYTWLYFNCAGKWNEFAVMTRERLKGTYSNYEKRFLDEVVPIFRSIRVAHE